MIWMCFLRWFRSCVNLVCFSFACVCVSELKDGWIHDSYLISGGKGMCLCFLSWSDRCVCVTFLSVSHFLFYLQKRSYINIYGKTLYRYIRYETLKVTSCNSGCNLWSRFSGSPYLRTHWSSVSSWSVVTHERIKVNHKDVLCVTSPPQTPQPPQPVTI